MNEIHIYFPKSLNSGRNYYSPSHINTTHKTKETHRGDSIDETINFLKEKESPIQFKEGLGGQGIFEAKESKNLALIVSSNSYSTADQEVYTKACELLDFKPLRTLVISVPKIAFNKNYKHFKEDSHVEDIRKVVDYLSQSRVPFFMVWDDDNGAQFIAGNNKTNKTFLNYKHRKTLSLVQWAKKIKARIRHNEYAHVVANDTVRNLYLGVNANSQ